MARPLRIEYEGACYHVMNRGNQRCTVFHSDSHYELFLAGLGHFALQIGIRVHSYCLMPNYFHVLLPPAVSCTLAEIVRRSGVSTGALCGARARVAKAIEHQRGRALSKRLAAVVSELEVRQKLTD